MSNYVEQSPGHEYRLHSS